MWPVVDVCRPAIAIAIAGKHHHQQRRQCHHTTTSGSNDGTTTAPPPPPPPPSPSPPPPPPSSFAARHIEATPVVGHRSVPADSLASYGSHYEKP
ncbi:hypothetical protein KM043_014160 [Ampulex compressa]|nr:hypothetical protein KM043_014160 [Ampulex compressa]